MTTTFGDRLARAMKAANMGASDVARLCAVSRQTVAKWLKMREADLAAKHAVCIADATGVEIRELVTGGRS